MIPYPHIDYLFICLIGNKMKVFCFFYGTGDDFKENYKKWIKAQENVSPKERITTEGLVGLERAKYIAKYRVGWFIPKWSLDADYCMLVEGVHPHGTAGLNTYATDWISNNIVRDVIKNNNKIRREYNKDNAGYNLVLDKEFKESMDSLIGRGIHLLIKTNGKWEYASELPDFLDQPVNLYLTGFSRGSVMTFLLGKALSSYNNIKVHIAAIEPVPGNIYDTEQRLGVHTMFGNAVSLAGCDNIKSCVIGLGTYHGYTGFKPSFIKPILKQMCPQSQRSNSSPSIRPFIFKKDKHVSSDQMYWVYLMAMHYAGFPVRDPYGDFYDTTKYRFEERDESGGDIGALAVTEREIKDGNSILGLIGLWYNYIIRPSDCSSSNTLKRRLDNLLKITANETGSVLVDDPLLINGGVYSLACKFLYDWVFSSANEYMKANTKGSAGYKRVEALKRELESKLSINSESEENAHLLKIELFDATLYEYVSKKRIAGQVVGGAFNGGDVLNQGPRSFGTLMAKNLLKSFTDLRVSTKSCDTDALPKHSGALIKYLYDTNGNITESAAVAKLKTIYGSRVAGLAVPSRA